MNNNTQLAPGTTDPTVTPGSYDDVLNDTSVEDREMEQYLLFYYNCWRYCGLVSICGSLFVMVDISRKPNDRVMVVNQVIIALCVADILFSFFGCFLAQWPAPRGASIGGVSVGAVGTELTCEITGHLESFGFFTSTGFTASLAICYLLMVRYHCTEKMLQKWRPVLLLAPIMLYMPFFVMTILWDATTFNGTMCGVMTTYPYGCDNVNIMCEKGGQLYDKMFRPDKTELLYLYGYITFVAGSILVTCLILMFVAVLQRERANDRYRIDGSANRRLSKQMAVQSIFFTLAFLATEVAWFVSVIFMGAGLTAQYPKAFITYDGVMAPLQGFWNALVYLRPRYWPVVEDYMKRYCCFCTSCSGKNLRESTRFSTRFFTTFTFTKKPVNLGASASIAAMCNKTLDSKEIAGEDLEATEHTV